MADENRGELKFYWYIEERRGSHNSMQLLMTLYTYAYPGILFNNYL